MNSTKWRISLAKQLRALCLVFIYVSGFSQTPIGSYPLSVCYQMTTNIIFPYRIEKADIGSGDVIAQKGGKLENVLFIKAARKYFPATNLSVYTSDGKFYSFIVKYSAQPDTLNLSFASSQIFGTDGSNTVNAAKLDSDALRVEKQENFLHEHVRVQKIRINLNGIYVKDHLLWFRFEIKNNSQIDFEPETIKFSIQDKHIAKLTAVQENEKAPVWETPNSRVPAQHKDTVVFAFPAFTLSRQKRLIIRMAEKNGGRILILPIPAKTILHCRKVES
jgi:conjugative transposon TraN protein